MRSIIGPYRSVLDVQNARQLGVIHAFFDLYVLNELWFRTVGYSEYGYPLRLVVPERKGMRISEVFERRVAEVKALVVKGLERSVRNEAKHFTNWCTCSRPVRILFTKRRRQICVSKWPLEWVHWLFELEGWDEFYGGERWAKATECLIRLKESRTAKDDLYWLDRIFDLQHNTGFILNKTRLKVLDEQCVYMTNRYLAKPLNVRFHYSPEQMLPLCSPRVRHLWVANRNYLTLTN